MWTIIRKKELERLHIQECRLMHLEDENKRLMHMHLRMSTALESMQRVLEKWFK